MSRAWVIKDKSDSASRQDNQSLREINNTLHASIAMTLAILRDVLFITATSPNSSAEPTSATSTNTPAPLAPLPLAPLAAAMLASVCRP